MCIYIYYIYRYSIYIYIRGRKDIENRRQTSRIKLHCISMADRRGTRCICIPVLCPARCTKTVYRVIRRARDWPTVRTAATFRHEDSSLRRAPLRRVLPTAFGARARAARRGTDLRARSRTDQNRFRISDAPCRAVGRAVRRAHTYTGRLWTRGS